MNNSKILCHLVEPLQEKWYHLDEDYRIWSCPCKDTKDKIKVSLCLTLDDVLKKEGELRDITRKVAEKRKELNLLQK